MAGVMIITAALYASPATGLRLSSCTRVERNLTRGSAPVGMNAAVKVSPPGALFSARGPSSPSIASHLSVQAMQAASHSSSEAPSPSVASNVIVIDNYDSFTYNLCQYLGDLGCDYEVVRNDAITIEELKERKPRGILISPGPGAPKDSGIALASILQLGSQVPIFGVCMGLQCMGEAFGGKIVRAPNGVMHGKTSKVYYDEKGEDGLLAGLPNPFVACRYHSLVIEKESFPSDELEVTAWTMDGLIMGIRHRKYKHIQGVQFHPESIITPDGKNIIANFLKILEQKNADQQIRKLPKVKVEA